MNALIEKVKKLKHKEVIVAILIALVLCLICFGLSPKTKSAEKKEISTQEISSTTEYVDNLQNRLNNVLSKISGVGKVSVIITLESGFSYEYATDTETKTVVSGGTETTVTTETVIMDGDKPVVEKEIFPTIKGVVVVAEGAENFAVKMKIQDAVETVLQIEGDKITILC